MALSFWKVAMRPGRPLMHGRLGAMQVLGLPGNPVSSYVCAFLFLVPLIRKLAGRDDLTIPSEPAVLGCDLPENDERADYLRALLTDGPDGPGRDTLPHPGQFDDGAAGEIRLPGDPRTARAGGESRQRLRDGAPRSLSGVRQIRERKKPGTFVPGHCPPTSPIFPDD